MSASDIPEGTVCSVPQMYSMENFRASQPMLPSMSSLLRHESLQETTSLFEKDLVPSYRDPSFSSHYACQLENQQCSFDHVEIPRAPVRMENLTSSFSYPKLTQRRQNKRIVQRKFEHHKDRRDKDGYMALRKGGNYLKELRPESCSKDPLDYSSLSLPSSRMLQPKKTQSMPISSLLSDPIAYVFFQDNNTQTNLHRPLPHPDPTYKLQVRQQPIAARACGFGERDRRVIDPPPILQITTPETHVSSEEMKLRLHQNYAVVHCVLWDPKKDCDNTIMPSTSERRHQRRLMGTVVASPFFGQDEYGVDGCFFTFPDLSVRTPGTYSLKFSLIILSAEKMVTGASAPVKSSVLTCPFEVFNAKDFCGMRPSTELTKRLKYQGCMISVKKGSLKTGAKRHEEKEDGEGQNPTPFRQRSSGDDARRNGRKRSLQANSAPYSTRPPAR